MVILSSAQTLITIQQYNNTISTQDQVGKFLNRLSDYLFQLARQVMEERNRIYGSGEGELKFKKRQDLGGRRGKAR